MPYYTTGLEPLFEKLAAPAVLKPLTGGNRLKRVPLKDLKNPVTGQKPQLGAITQRNVPPGPQNTNAPLPRPTKYDTVMRGGRTVRDVNPVPTRPGGANTKRTGAPTRVEKNPTPTRGGGAATQRMSGAPTVVAKKPRPAARTQAGGAATQRMSGTPTQVSGAPRGMQGAPTVQTPAVAMTDRMAGGAPTLAGGAATQQMRAPLVRPSGNATQVTPAGSVTRVGGPSGTPTVQMAGVGAPPAAANKTIQMVGENAPPKFQDKANRGSGLTPAETDTIKATQAGGGDTPGGAEEARKRWGLGKKLLVGTGAGLGAATLGAGWLAKKEHDRDLQHQGLAYAPVSGTAGTSGLY